MRINNVTSVRFENKPSASRAVSCRETTLNVSSSNYIPNFTAYGLIRRAKKSVLPSVLQNLPGVTYKAEFMNKGTRATEKGFLSYMPYPGCPEYKDIRVYSKDGQILGKLSLDYNEWRTNNLSRPYLALDCVESRHNYKYYGIGQLMMQAAVEKSLQNGHQGRIYLYASNIYNDKNDPFVFYKKMGFTLLDPRAGEPNLEKYLNKLSPEELENYQKRISSCDMTIASADERMMTIYQAAAEARGCSLAQVPLRFAESMFLEDRQVKELWLPRIQKNPIFRDGNLVE